MKVGSAWGIWDGKELWPDFFRLRMNAQIYAARRGMGSPTFKQIVGVAGPIRDFEAFRPIGPEVAALWKEFKRNHKGAKLVRVKVTMQ